MNSNTGIKGPYIVLHKRAHVLGRRVEEDDYRFASLSVSGTHCNITRKILTTDGEVKSLNADAVVGDEQCTFIEDLSAYGTFLDAKRVQISDPTIRLEHGAVLSLAGSLDNDQAFAFVYQEVPPDIYGENEVCMKDHRATIFPLAAGAAADGQPIAHDKQNVDTGDASPFHIVNIKKTNRHIPWIVAVVETAEPKDYGDMTVTLKDPTGKIGGTVHRKVLTGLEDGKLIKPEAALVI
ncbi:unnamed protein product [Calypogeia fissa]